MNADYGEAMSGPITAVAGQSALGLAFAKKQRGSALIRIKFLLLDSHSFALIRGWWPFHFWQFWQLPDFGNFKGRVAGIFFLSPGASPTIVPTSRARLASQCEPAPMAKVFTIPVVPDPARRRSRNGKQTSDPRYIEGQRLLVEAMKYLVQQDPEQNKDAVMLLSEHFRTRFRMTDRPEEVHP